MDENAITDGLAELEELAQDEYKQKLNDVMTGSDAMNSAERLGRLAGVLLKEPFSEPKELKKPSEYSAAYREWNLPESDEEIDLEGNKSTWQYQALEQIRNDLSEFDAELSDVRTVILAAHYESGFAAYLLRSVRKYLCGDEEIRKKVSATLEAAKLEVVTPETVVGAGGMALGSYLVSVIPVLGIVGAPVIAAVVLILYSLGMDAYCSWTDNLETRQAERN